MKARSRCSVLLFVSSAFAASTVFAGDALPPNAAPAAAGGAKTGAVETAPPAVTASASMHVLRERMREMRRTSDPARRMQLMEAQMNQLDDVIRGLDGVCPTPDLAPGMMGMTNSGRTGAMSNDEMIAKRIEMMEKRMDMMQMMLQRQNAATTGADAADARR